MNSRMLAIRWSLAVLFSGFIVLPCAAQYKCVVNGRAIYADTPCGSDARPVGALEDRVSKDAEIERLRQSLSERQQRERIEAREDADYRERQRALQQNLAAEAAQLHSEQASSQRRCAGLQREMDHNRQALARYQDFGWQRQLTEQERQLRRNQESYDHDCR